MLLFCNEYGNNIEIEIFSNLRTRELKIREKSRSHGK